MMWSTDSSSCYPPAQHFFSAEHIHKGLVDAFLDGVDGFENCSIASMFYCVRVAIARSPILARKPRGVLPEVMCHKFDTIRWNTSGGLGAGDAIYQQALQAMEEVKEIQRRKDDQRSTKMYEAWVQAQKAEKSPKTQGVTVVKTLVKETRKDKEQSNKQTEEESQAWRRAMVLLEQAAWEHNHPMALVQLGNIALEKAGSKDLRKDSEKRRSEIDKAIQLFEKAGLAGSRVGWFNLGHLFWNGYPVVQIDENDEGAATTPVKQILEPNLHGAMDAFVNAIDLGDTDAMYLVGVHRMTEGRRENIYSGMKLVERAAEEGHGGALYYLALLHLNGEPNTGLEPCTEAEFVERLDRAVDAGNVDAMFTRGHSYYHGTEGYPQNYQRALHDFLQAADEGHADAAVSGEYE